MTTAADRLVSLAGHGGTAGALLLAIGIGATSGAALVAYSGLQTGTAAEHLLAERQTVQATPSGGWMPQQRHRTRKEIDNERRRLGILPPVAEIAKTAVKKAVSANQNDEHAIREAIEALRAEIGKQEAALLRAAYVDFVRQELERLRREDEEAVAMLLVMLA